MDYLKKSRIEEVLIAILGKGTVTSQLISRIEKILDAIRVKGSYDGIVMSEVEEILVCILLGERFEKPTHSRIAAMLKVKANGGEYTELRKSRVEELIFEWIEGTSKIITYTGTLPATLQTVAGYLAGYKIWGNTGGVGIETENLFSSSFSANYSISPSGEVMPYTQNSSRCATLTPINVSNLTTVTFSFTNTSSNDLKQYIYALYDGSTLVLRNAFKESGSSINVSRGNKLYLCIYSNDANIDSSQTIANVMLNLGSAAISYEPYGYKLPILSNNVTTDIYIGDTQLAKDEYVDSSEGKIYKWAAITGLSEPLYGINSYADALDLSTGTLTRKIKKLVLTGEESWRATSGRVYLDALLDDYMRHNGVITCICTHYVAQEQVASASRVSEGCITLGSEPTSQRLYIYDTNISTAADFKSYLASQYAAGTPVTIWYVLAESAISTVPVPSGLTGTIEGYLIQDGTPTPENPIYPTANGTKQADGTYSIESVYLTPTDPPTPFPQIPTFAGETTISYGGAGAQPKKVELTYKTP